MSPTSLQKLNLLFASLCILILGILIGKYQERMQINTENSQIIALNRDINETVPYLKILAIQDGELKGIVNNPQIRLTTEKEVALINDELQFTLPINDVLRKDLKINAPAGMNYVASRNGTKFYNIYDTAAQKLSPTNYVFFATKQEAQNAGYTEN